MTTRAITGKAIETITNLLNLRPQSQYSQNWEAEVVQPNDLVRYLDCYETAKLTDDEKYALMSLILYAFEDAEKIALPNLLSCEARIALAIRNGHPLHLSHLMYWSLPDEESDDPDCLFTITPFVRRLAATLA